MHILLAHYPALHSKIAQLSLSFWEPPNNVFISQNFIESQITTELSTVLQVFHPQTTNKDRPLHYLSGPFTFTGKRGKFIQQNTS